MFTYIYICDKIAIQPNFCCVSAGEDNLPTMFIFSFRSDAAYIVATTQAAPPMSPLISSILALGFRLMPPLSKVTPLPAHSDHKHQSYFLSNTITGHDPAPWFIWALSFKLVDKCDPIILPALWLTLGNFFLINNLIQMVLTQHKAKV